MRNTLELNSSITIKKPTKAQIKKVKTIFKKNKPKTLGEAVHLIRTNHNLTKKSMYYLVGFGSDLDIHKIEDNKKRPNTLWINKFKELFDIALDKEYSAVRRYYLPDNCFKIDGNLLRSLREKEGLSLNALARKLGISHSAISSYERGIYSANINYIKKISNHFKIDPTELVVKEEVKDYLEKVKNPLPEYAVKVKEARLRTILTQQELETLLKVPKGIMKKLETGSVSYIEEQHLCIICEYLGLSYNKIKSGIIKTDGTLIRYVTVNKELIRNKMKEKKITYRELEYKTKIPMRTLFSIIKENKTKLHNLNLIKKIAKVLKLDIYDTIIMNEDLV